MAENAILLGVLAIAIMAIILFWIVRKKHESGVGDLTEEYPSVSEFYTVFGRSALIEYTPTNHYENATKAVVSSLLGAGKNVVLITQAPRARMHYDMFHSFAKKGSLKVVNITSENPLARPQMFRVAPAAGEAENDKKEKNLFLVSVNNLELLNEITEEMGVGSVLIFEATTGIILALGKEKKEAVYKFFSTIVEAMSANERTLVAFLNRSAHEREIVSAYEGLFIKIFKIEDDFIVSLKGRKVKIPIEIQGEKNNL
jgi:hypothetical protein